MVSRVLLILYNLSRPKFNSVTDKITNDATSIPNSWNPMTRIAQNLPAFHRFSLIILKNTKKMSFLDSQKASAKSSCSLIMCQAMNKYKPQFCESMLISSLVEIVAEDYEEDELCANMAEIMKKLTHFSSSFLHRPISIYFSESVFIFMSVFKYVLSCYVCIGLLYLKRNWNRRKPSESSNSDKMFLKLS